MRRGQTTRVTEGVGFTKRDLLEAGAISAKSFDTMRKVARIRGPSHGCLDWVFSYDDVRALIRTAEGGRYTLTGGPVAAGWRTIMAERGQRVEPKDA